MISSRSVLVLAALCALAFGGCTGSDGLAGMDGMDGVDGMDGIDGTPGTPGMDGMPAVSVGSIMGTVADLTGAALADVSITSDPATVTVTSDATGAFAFIDVPVGAYSLIATLPGFEDFTLVAVGVAGGSTTNVSLALTPGGTAPGTIGGTVLMANGDPLAGATVTVDGGTATATTAADGTFALADVTPGFVFIQATPPDPALFLPGETRRSVYVRAGTSVMGVEIRVSGRPSDAATYVGSTACATCHGATVTAEHASAHYRSLTPDSSRIINPELFPAVGGTVATGQTGLDPAGGATMVAIYACQNTSGVYSFKFGGTADCTVLTDGTLVPVAGTYGGEGDGGVDDVPNLGTWKQRFFARLDDVPAAAGWVYTAGRDLDWLIIPAQITQSGDGGARWGGYHGNDWTNRGRTFSRKCAGCHVVDLDIEWDAAGLVTSFGYRELNIGCETCHGPGSDHVAAPGATRANNIVSSRNLTAEAMNGACGMCHAADAGSSVDPSGWFGYPYNAGNAALVGGGLYVPGVYDPADYVRGYGVARADGGGFDAWPDARHGMAHRQQVPMLAASVHGNNPYLRLTCADCHNTHTLFQGPAEHVIGTGTGAFEFTTPTFDDNVLCLSCHATHGPYAGVSTEDVAVAFLAAGGAVSHGGTAMALSDYTNDEILTSMISLNNGVGGHMGDEVGMALAAYEPLNDAMPVGRCASCHMPRTAKSGGWTTGLDALGRTALVEGDQGSHVFDVVWPAQSAALRRMSGGSDTNIMPNSCGGCHEGARLSGN